MHLNYYPRRVIKDSRSQAYNVSYDLYRNWEAKDN